VELKDVALAMADQFATTGVGGAVALADLSPPKTPPGQRIVASTLKVGALELTQGAVEFQVRDADTIHVERTQWLAFGGTVWAGDFVIDAQAPIQVTLHAQGIELKELLDTFARGKASGQGRISGELPLTIAGSNVQFGDGRVVSLQGGQVQIKDAETLAAVAAGAAAAAQSPSQKEQLQRNIIQALSDFQYDRLTAQLQSDPGGQLSAHIRMRGHGRTGAKQGLDYELNLHRLDLALKSYLSITGAMQVPRAAATRATGKVSGSP
jgi:hypothetical protein